VTVEESIPSPGPGDFLNRWPTAEEAIDDVLDYYFGDPSRMEPLRKRSEIRLKKELRDVVEKFADEVKVEHWRCGNGVGSCRMTYIPTCESVERDLATDRPVYQLLAEMQLELKLMVERKQQ
jgi:hypothetical protein